MILSRGRNYIFVHAPKTGGTSLALALEARAMKDDILIGDTPKAKRRRKRMGDVTTRGRLWKHSTLADLEGLVCGAELATLFAFTMVRNPWDRMVSYYHWLQAQRFDHAAVTLAQRLEFDAFVQHPQTIAALSGSPARHYMADAHGVERGDLYIRLEHFDRDAQALWDHLGFELTLPHANQSARDADFRGYYTEKTRDVVAQAAAEDISRFGYSFD